MEVTLYICFMKKFLLLILFLTSLSSCQQENSNGDFKVNPLVENMYDRYVSAWSEADFETIVEEIYETPFLLFYQDTTIVYNSKNAVKSFLIKTFNQLETNNYGYSIRNDWEHYKVDDNLVVIEMNFTRFLKDSTIMGAKERKATYILRESDGKFKISGMIPHTSVAE